MFVCVFVLFFFFFFFGGGGCRVGSLRVCFGPADSASEVLREIQSCNDVKLPSAPRPVKDEARTF